MFKQSDFCGIAKIPLTAPLSTCSESEASNLTNDQHLREVMGRHSREIAEQELDVKPYAKRLVALYESLVDLEKT
jgi:hypothetical protein